MKSSLRLPLLALVAALAIGGAWLATRAAAPSEVEQLPAVGAADAPQKGVARAAELDAPREARGTAEPERAAADPEPVEPAAAPAPFRAPDDSLWIAGRVVFPDYTPLDEEVRVVARGKAFPGTDRVRTHEVRVERDGAFRLAVAKGTRTATVKLQGHYLYLDASVRVKMAELEDELVLEPVLGGRLLTRVTLPAGVDEAELDDASVVAVLYSEDGAPLQRGSEGHEAGVFEVAAVPALRKLDLVADSPRCARVELEHEAVEPGATVEVQIALMRGARISGRVVGPGGAGLAGVQVEVHAAGDGSGTQTTSETEADGTFEAVGLPAGEVELTAWVEGLREVSLELGVLADGEARTGVLLTLDEGNVVAGIVQWPDGTPASGARVTAHQADPDGGGFIVQEDTFQADTDDEGRFRLAGLSDESCTVRARARRTGGGARRGPYWRAELPDVAPRSSSLVLVLEAGATVSGRVVDDTGAPVEAFRVRVREPSAPGVLFDLTNKPSFAGSFTDAGGAFAVEGVSEGEWTAVASAKGHADSRAVPVEVPQSGELLLVVERLAVVRGVVLDSAGRPIARAHVEAEGESDNWWGGDDEGDTTSRDGRFELELAPGEYTLRAHLEGHAPSADETLELVPDEHRDLTLVLRRPGSIRGVVDPAMGPVAGREVDLDHVDGPGYDSMETNSRGEFAFHGLAPGTYELDLGEPQGLDETEEAVDFDDLAFAFSMTGSQSTLTVELAEGEDLEVVLGGAALDPITVTGKVVEGGEPAGGVRLAWERDDRSGTTVAMTQADGTYEVVVDGPGDYQVSAGARWGDRVDFEVTVPAGPVYSHDLVLPACHIAGTVFGPDGDPARVSVSVRSDGQLLGDVRSTQTEEDGSFVVRRLDPGTYNLSAGTEHWFGGDTGFGRVTRRALVLEEGGTLDGLEIHLPRSARIEGIVRAPDGTVATGVQISVRDEHGEQLEHWSSVWTNDSGRYSYGNLGPGTYTVRARQGDLSDESEVVVVEGSAYDVDLTLKE